LTYLALYLDLIAVLPKLLSPQVELKSSEPHASAGQFGHRL